MVDPVWTYVQTFVVFFWKASLSLHCQTPVQEKLLCQKNCYPKKVLVKTEFGPKNFWVKNNFRSKNIWVQQKFWSQKNVGSKKIWVLENFWTEKIGLKVVGSKLLDTVY